MLGTLAIPLVCNAASPILLRTSGASVTNVPLPDQHWDDTNAYAICIDYGTNATSILDNSGNNYHLLKLPNTTEGPAIKFGTNSLDELTDYWTLDGASSYATGGIYTVSTTTLTWTAWVRTPDNSQAYATFWEGHQAVSNLSEFGLQMGATGNHFMVWVRQANGVVKSSPEVGTVANDTWYHVAGMADGSKVRAFVNAVEIGTGTAYDGTILAGDISFFMGRHFDAGTPLWLAGDVDFATLCAYTRTYDSITNEYIYTHPTNNIRKRTP